MKFDGIDETTQPEDPQATERQIINTYDVKGSVAQFNKYELIVAEWKNKVAALAINSEQGQIDATQKGVQISQLEKLLEKERHKIIDEPYAYYKGVNAFFKRFSDPLVSLKRDIKKKMGVYAAFQRQEAMKREQAAEKERKRQQAEIDAAAKKHNIETVTLPTQVITKKPQPVRAESGSSSIRYKWVFKVVNPGVVPIEYLAPCDDKLKAAMDAGIRSIPGVEFSEEPIVSLRG